MSYPGDIIILHEGSLPKQNGWLQQQTVPVVAIAELTIASSNKDRLMQTYANADVVVDSITEANYIQQRAKEHPFAAQVLAQTLRIVNTDELYNSMVIESLAYSVLQAGPEFQDWLTQRQQTTKAKTLQQNPVLLQRQENTLSITLNRPENFNSLTIELRDALIEALDLAILDDSITGVELSGAGRCFCTGGELSEFGLASSPAAAHSLRLQHSPCQRIVQCADKIHAKLHGACIGAGIELPAFAHKVTSAKKAYFQLPELSMGLIPGAGGCVSISRRIGRHRTAWMVLTGKKINTTTALQWGLIDNIT